MGQLSNCSVARRTTMRRVDDARFVAEEFRPPDVSGGKTRARVVLRGVARRLREALSDYHSNI